jgi:ankyrin repeat protein
MSARLCLSALLMTLVGCASEQDKALIAAAGGGDVAEIKRLVDSGANVNAIALDDWTPLTRAADRGRFEAVRLLIESGADVNKPAGDLYPLFFAADNGHVVVVKLLLENGAKLNLPEADRNRFLHDIESHHDPELVKLLAGQLP